MSIFTKAFNKLGYDSLSQRFPGASEPQGERWENRCAQFVWDVAGPLWQAARAGGAPAAQPAGSSPSGAPPT